MCKVFCLVVIFVFGLFNKGVNCFKIEAVRDCDDVIVKKIDGFAHEAKINDDGSFTGYLKVPFQVDDNILFRTSFSTWEDGKWKKESFELAEDLCGALNTYIPTLWGKIADKVKVPHECPIPAGEYRLENFVVSEDDIDMPAVDLSSNVLIQSEYSKDGKIFVCKQVVIS